jgi:hypothetical protein
MMLFDATVPTIVEVAAEDVVFCITELEVLFWYTADAVSDGMLKPIDAAVPALLRGMLVAEVEF